MYIELFIADNLIMDALIVRLAGAFAGCRVCWKRTLIAASTGSMLAVLTVLYPLIGCWPAKTAICLLAGLALPVKTLRSYVTNVVCMMLSAFLCGGLTLCASLISGGGIQDGIVIASLPLRGALIAALLCCALPSVVRRSRSRMPQCAVLSVTVNGSVYPLCCVIDTGSSLCEPLTGIPAALINIPGLSIDASIPVPAVTASGQVILSAFKPERAVLSSFGRSAEIDIFLAESQYVQPMQAIYPAYAMPESLKEVYHAKKVI